MAAKRFIARVGMRPNACPPWLRRWPGRSRLSTRALTLEMLAYGRQKPAYSHFMARIFRKILAEHLTHFIRKLL